MDQLGVAIVLRKFAPGGVHQRDDTRAVEHRNVLTERVNDVLQPRHLMQRRHVHEGDHRALDTGRWQQCCN